MEVFNSLGIFYTIFIIHLRCLEARFSCEFKRDSSHVAKLFFGTSNDVSTEDCGLIHNEKDLVAGFPWDVTVYFENEQCVAPGVIISQKAILFGDKITGTLEHLDFTSIFTDIGTCHYTSQSIITIFLAGIKANYAEAPKLKATKIFTVPSTNNQIAITYFENDIRINNATVTPACLYNKEEWNGANFYTFLATEDDSVANVKFSLRYMENCARRVKTSTQCTKFNSYQFLCVEPSDQTDVFSSSEFLYLKQEERYFLRGKFIEIYPEAYATSTVLDLSPSTPLIVHAVPDLYAIVPEPETKQEKHKFKYPDNLSYPECGRPTPPISSNSSGDLPNSSNVHVSNLIVNGTEVVRERLHHHPWHALFVAKYYIAGFEVSSTSCGGTLISDKVIVTAAHCLYTPGVSVTLLDPSESVVYVGAHAMLDDLEETRQMSEVQNFIIHEEYNIHSFDNDIALLVIKSPFKISLYVRPACLWNSYPSIEDVIGIIGHVVGFGLNENYEVSETLRKAEIPIISHKECFKVDRKFYNDKLTSKRFCAGLNGVSVCNGDSGGGFIIYSDSKRRFFLRGIVSLSKAKLVDRKNVCDASVYALFTDIVPYIPWILSKTEIN